MPNEFARIFTLIFHSFFPAWKLFDRPGDSCRVFYRPFSVQHNSDWLEIKYPQGKRNLTQLIFNPQDSQWLYFFSIIDQLATEITKNQNLQLESFRHFSQLQGFLRQYIFSQQSVSIQIKIIAKNELNKPVFEYISDGFQC